MINRMQTLYHVSSKQVPTVAELDARKGARRSLFFTSNMKKGSTISEADLVELRPGTFCPANEVGSFIGQKLTCDVEVNMPVDHNNIK